MRVFVVVDVSNLYCCVRDRFNGSKIDYSKFFDFCRSKGEIYNSVAFCTALTNDGDDFFKRLQRLGFNVNIKQVKEYRTKEHVTRKADCDVNIAMAVARVIDRVDIVILGSADGDLAPVLDYVHEKGAKVIVIGCGISGALKEKADSFVEITPEFLEKRKLNETSKTTKQLELSSNSFRDAAGSTSGGLNR